MKYNNSPFKNKKIYVEFDSIYYSIFDYSTFQDLSNINNINEYFFINFNNDNCSNKLKIKHSFNKETIDSKCLNLVYIFKYIKKKYNVTNIVLLGKGYSFYKFNNSDIKKIKHPIEFNNKKYFLHLFYDQDFFFINLNTILNEIEKNNYIPLKKEYRSIKAFLIKKNKILLKNSFYFKYKKYILSILSLLILIFSYISVLLISNLNKEYNDKYINYLKNIDRIYQQHLFINKFNENFNNNDIFSLFSFLKEMHIDNKKLSYIVNDLLNKKDISYSINYIKHNVKDIDNKNILEYLDTPINKNKIENYLIEHFKFYKIKNLKNKNLNYFIYKKDINSSELFELMNYIYNNNLVILKLDIKNLKINPELYSVIIKLEINDKNIKRYKD